MRCCAQESGNSAKCCRFCTSSSAPTATPSPASIDFKSMRLRCDRSTELPTEYICGIFAFEQAKTKASFLKKLRQNPPDLVIGSVSVPGLEGTKALTLAREENSDLPFIYFTNPIKDKNLVETLKRDATDHVFKDRADEL